MEKIQVKKWKIILQFVTKHVDLGFSSHCWAYNDITKGFTQIFAKSE